MFSTGSHRSESKSSITAIQTHPAPLAKSDSVFEEKLHACRTKTQQIRMNFTTIPSDHNKTFKSNPRNEAEIHNKTEWKKFTGKNFKSWKKRSYRNRRKFKKLFSEENESKSKQAFMIVQRKRVKNEAFAILPS